MDVDSEPDFYKMPFLPDRIHPNRSVVGPAQCIAANQLPDHHHTSFDLPQMQVQLQDAFNQYALQLQNMHSAGDAPSILIPPMHTLPVITQEQLFSSQHQQQQDASGFAQPGGGEVSSDLDQKPAAQLTLASFGPSWSTSCIGKDLNSAQGQTLVQNPPGANQTTPDETSIPTNMSATQSEAASSVLYWNLGRTGCIPNNLQNKPQMHSLNLQVKPHSLPSTGYDSTSSNQTKQQFIQASFPNSDLSTNSTNDAFFSNQNTSVAPAPITTQAPQPQPTTVEINQQSIALLSNPPNHPILKEFAEHYLPFFDSSSGESGSSDEKGHTDDIDGRAS